MWPTVRLEGHAAGVIRHKKDVKRSRATPRNTSEHIVDTERARAWRFGRAITIGAFSIENLFEGHRPISRLGHPHDTETVGRRRPIVFN